MKILPNILRGWTHVRDLGHGTHELAVFTETQDPLIYLNKKEAYEDLAFHITCCNEAYKRGDSIFPYENDMEVVEVEVIDDIYHDLTNDEYHTRDSYV